LRSLLTKRVKAIPPSGLRRFFDIAATMDDVISLGIGEPDFTTPEHISQAGIDSIKAGKTSYTSNSGLSELREAIAGYLKTRHQVDYNPENEILVSVGVSEGMHLTMQTIVDIGDEVIIPQPSFLSYPAEVTLAGGVPVPIKTVVENNFQVTASEIEAVITPKSKVLLIGYPCNPTGAILKRKTLEEIAEVVIKHDLIVISDEIYEQLTYGAEHVCVASLPGMRERTILLNGFSKAYAMTGWRLGYAAAPVEYVASMRKIHQYTIMSAPTMSQYAALRAIQAGADDVESMRQEYDRRRRLIVDGFNELGLDCFEPLGAFYAFPSVAKTGMSDLDFCETLLEEEKIATIPGRYFGAGGEGYIRCSYCTSYEKIEIVLERMHNFLQRHG